MKPTKTPTATVIKDGAVQSAKVDTKLLHAVMRAWDIKKQITALEAQYAPLSEEISAALLGRSMIVASVCRVTVSQSTRITVADAEKLRRVLGTRFDDLVDVSETARPREKLIEISSDGDHPLRPQVAQCLKIAKSTAVRFLSEK